MKRENWWNHYIGIPYVEQGRDRAAGLDCWGLVRLVHNEQFGHELPSLTGDYTNIDDPAHLAELIAREKESWQKVDIPREGDMVLMRVLGRSHVGMVTEPGKFLHVREHQTSTIETLSSPVWRNRIKGFYRYSPNTALVEYSAAAHPLRTERIEGLIPAGRTVKQTIEHLRAQQGVSPEMPFEAVVWVDGREIAQAEWDTCVPAPGSRVEVRAVARNSAIGRMVGLLAVMVVAWYFAPMLAGAVMGVPATLVAPGAIAVAQAAITVAGSMLVNSIFPVRPPDVGAGDAGPQRQLLMQGGQNRANPYGAIPVVLGRFRYTAPLAAQSYVESNATTSYLRMALLWGYGPLAVSDMRIGDVPITQYEDVQIETVNGEAGQDMTRFNSIYGKDVKQLSPQAELLCPRVAVTSASRTTDVVTVVTSAPHNYSVNAEAVLVDGNGATLASGTITEVTNSTTFKFNHAGADGAIAAANVRASAWLEYVIDEEVDQLKATLHFPMGLRQGPVEGGNAGDIDAANYRAILQYRQLDSNTLAPITGWGDFDKTVRAENINLAAAWFNTDSDAQLEKVYQWTRISVDEYGQVIIRTGAMTNSQFDNPTGTLLTRLQQSNFGLNVVFERLPVIGIGEELLWDVCVFGNDVVTLTDQRDVSITGCNLTNVGRMLVLNTGSITRADVENIRLGGTGEPFYKRKDAFTHNITMDVARGKYQLRIRRTNESNDDYSYPSGNAGRRFHSSYLQAVTGYSNRRPITPPKPLAMTALRIKATNQLNGNIEGVTATVQSVCLDYDVGTGTWIERPTRNPASLMRYVLQHPANAKKVSDSLLDLPSFVEFHNYCRTNGFTYDAVLADQRSLWDVLLDIAAAGRASPTRRDGKHSVVIDKARTSVAQHFTPHNSWGFESTRALPQLPHAFRVQFNNAEKSYQPDERIVYNDGYSSANATLFEGLQLPGVTQPATVFKHARFHYAQLKLRPEQYTLYADIEHLVCQRGDLVRVVHDVPMWGLASGRIKDFISTTVIELDEPVPMKANTSYTIRIRAEDGSSVTRTVAQVGADTYASQITLTAAITETQGKPLNLFMFGELGQESVELVVHAIEPAENMSARLTLVDYSPAVYDSDSEAVPPWDSQITLPPIILQDRITQKPTITRLQSDEAIIIRTPSGGYNYGLQVSWDDPENLPRKVNGVQLEIDFANDNRERWEAVATVPLRQRSHTFRNLREGQEYVVRLRYVDRDGLAGPWQKSVTHTIVGKTTPPRAVTGLAIGPDNSGRRLLLSWDANDEIDISGYEVRTADTNWGTPTGLLGLVFRGKATSVVVTPPPLSSPARTWYVKAFDRARLYSLLPAQITYTKSNLPSVTGLTYSISASSTTDDKVRINWDNVEPAFDLKHYEVILTLPGGATRTYRGKTSEWTTNFNWVGIAVASVKIYDAHGDVSAAATLNIEKLKPADVGVITKTINRRRIELDWADVARTTLPVVGYEVRKTDAGWGTPGFVYRGRGSQTPGLLLAAGDNNYYVRAYDTDGDYSAVSATISHSYVAPATPTDFSAEVDESGTKIELTWGANTEKDLSGYEIRTANSGWGTAGFLWRGLATRRLVVPPKVVGAGTTWYIKAIDTDGLYSAAAAQVTFTKAAVPNVTGLTSTVSASSMTADQVMYNWNDVTPAFALKHYEATLTLPDATTRVYRGKTSEWITNFNWSGSATVDVRAVDVHGSKSGAVTLEINKVGPNNVNAGTFAKTARQARLTLDWANIPKTTLPVAGYEVRTSDSDWGTDGYKYRGIGSQCTLTMAQGVNTYYVRAFDTDGVYSGLSASISHTYSPPPNFTSLVLALQYEGISIVPQGGTNPADFLCYEYRIKFGVTTGDVWAAGAYDTVVQTTHPLYNYPTTAFGNYRIAARRLDKEGNYSTASVFANISLAAIDPP